MPATAKHLEVEERFRQLVSEAEIPEPDEVVYDPTAVGFYWHERKVVVFVDIDDPPEPDPNEPITRAAPPPT